MKVGIVCKSLVLLFYSDGAILRRGGTVASPKFFSIFFLVYICMYVCMYVLILAICLNKFALPPPPLNNIIDLFKGYKIFYLSKI